MYKQTSDTRKQLHNGLNNPISPTVTIGIIIQDKGNEKGENRRFF